MLAAARGLLAQVRSGALAHCDFHYENILQDGGRLSGLLDFEWAISGDPAYDQETARTRITMRNDKKPTLERAGAETPTA